MKPKTALVLAALALAGCTTAETRYAGSPGSTYDKEREPPHTVTPAGYDAMSPLKSQDFGNSGGPAPVETAAPPPR